MRKIMNLKLTLPCEEAAAEESRGNFRHNQYPIRNHPNLVKIMKIISIFCHFLQKFTRQLIIIRLRRNCDKEKRGHQRNGGHFSANRQRHLSASKVNSKYSA